MEGENRRGLVALPLKQRYTLRLILNLWFTPILPPVLRQLILLRILLLASFFQVMLMYFDLPGWKCPMKSLFGLSCPGCGLTSASALVIQGHWIDAIGMHAFAPVFFLGFIFLSIFSIMPNNIRRKIIDRTAKLEEQTGIAIFTLLAILFYWGVRSIVSI